MIVVVDVFARGFVGNVSGVVSVMMFGRCVYLRFSDFMVMVSVLFYFHFATFAG